MLVYTFPSAPLALGKWRQDDGKFKDILGYIVRTCLKKKIVEIFQNLSYVSMTDDYGN
jgi:hypothetical protein